MNEELVNSYYEKFMVYINERKSAYSDITKASKQLRKYLEIIVSMNRDYLLTDSFIDKMTISGTQLLFDLILISSPDNDRLYRCVTGYFYIPLAACMNHSGNINQARHRYVLKLDDETKRQIIKAYETCEYIAKNDSIHESEIISISLCLLAKCLIDKNISAFSDMADRLPINLEAILDLLNQNNIVNLRANEEKTARIIEDFYKDRNTVIL